MDSEKRNLKSVLQELYELNQGTSFITDGKPTTISDYQDLIYQYVEQLADLLGVELEG